MALGAARSRVAAADFLFLAAVGHHGLLPLLHEPREWPIKVPLGSLEKKFYRINLFLIITAHSSSLTAVVHEGRRCCREPASGP